MGNIIFLAAEVLFIGAVIYIVPFFSAVLITLFFLGFLYFWFERKEILYYLIPLLLLIRIFFTVNFNEIYPDEFIKIETKIVNSQGRIEKIDDKFTLGTMSIITEKVPDGKYILYGTMEKFGKNSFYYFHTIKKEEIPLNRFEIFFNNRLKTLRKYLSNKCGNLLQGVILGERRYIYKEIRDKFIYSGSAHLLAISGLHIGAVTGIILWTVNLIKIKREIRYSLAFVFLTIYVLGISVSPSVIRAYIMGGVFLAGKIFYEKTDIRKSFAAAVIGNLFLYPDSAGKISFILSYICLFTIIYIYPKVSLKRKIKFVNILNFFIFTGVIQIFILPVNLYFFKTIPFLSYFTNFFMTPIGMVFVTLGFVSFFVPEIVFAWFFAPILQIIYNLMEIMLNFFSRIPYLIIKYDNNLSLKFIIFIYIILTALFYIKEIKKMKKI